MPKTNIVNGMVITPEYFNDLNNHVHDVARDSQADGLLSDRRCHKLNINEHTEGELDFNRMPGHVHDGEDGNGHLPKINLGRDVTGKLPINNIEDHFHWAHHHERTISGEVQSGYLITNTVKIKFYQSVGSDLSIRAAMISIPTIKFHIPIPTSDTPGIPALPPPPPSWFFPITPSIPMSSALLPQQDILAPAYITIAEDVVCGYVKIIRNSPANNLVFRVFIPGRQFTAGDMGDIDVPLIQYLTREP